MDVEYEVSEDGLVSAFKIVDFDTKKPYEVKVRVHKGVVPKARSPKRWGSMYDYLEGCDVGTSECMYFASPKEARRAYQYINKRYKEGTIEVGPNGDNGVVFKIKKKLVVEKK